MGIWRHEGRELGVLSGGEEIHVGTASKVEQVPRDLQLEQPLHRENLDLDGKQIDDDIYLLGNVDCPGDPKIDDQLEYEFGLLPEGKEACPTSLFM